MKSFLIAIALLTTSAHAYIPPANVIVEKMTKKTISGGWRATFHTQLLGSEGIFEEIWTIQDGDAMRLKVRGISENNKDFTEDIVYRDGNRYRMKETGELVYIPLSPRYFERLFHFQTFEGAKKYLKAAGVLLSPSAEEPIAPTPVEPVGEEVESPETQFAYKPDPRVRLERVSGVIAYAIGEPQNREQRISQPAATLWVEQDRYNLKKFLLSSGSEIAVEPYKKYGKRWFPRARTVKWRGQKIQIHTVRLEKIRIGPKTKKFLLPQSIEKRAPREADIENSSLEISLMSEFYQRFR